MQGTAHFARLPLLVERIGERERVGIGLEHVAQRWTIQVQSCDAIQIQLRDGSRRHPPRRHPRLKFGERCLLELEWGNGKTAAGAKRL